ncbi:N-acetyl-gamma-glutamyl-phosphate reductase [Halobacteriales archaeon SW_10_68_16]|nr:MAG: N-acetyl-gamma-glutamyl-phosphate reductase [Halobacteriales archaeon SW_10_68_16]
MLRLLDGHPEFELVQATSRSKENKTVGHAHPNLRHLDLRFSHPEDLESVDVLFAATPHGVSMEQVDAFRDAAGTVIDLSADFRLDTAEQYEEWYDGHARPELLGEAVYALPELTREELPGADLVASGGCNATVTMLGLLPLVEDGILGGDERIVVDVKVGSSEGGAGGGEASSHPERSGVVRPYAPTGHRHEAEIEQFLGLDVSFTVHAVDMIRGASATCHVFPGGPVSKGDLWGAYRGTYEDEPFVDMVAGGGGVYRYPEPKAVAGTNRAEVGFELDAPNRRLVVFSAIDNMMKGSAGQAVHAANVALGFEETAGLEFQGLHPVGAP